ncbi:ABC transporter permease [Pseudomonas sp. UL073]|uniref:ABC transporter permease n=1 Tax=Zestomonas insulae TaxID=2809017 RepID=A0ABS2IFU5_9GAMM|nr:ABC transporter permease [Pseudomonas insulae]MBM7061962.1 ABC transporter permease [Pseudomonas insulae]
MNALLRRELQRIRAQRSAIWLLFLLPLIGTLLLLWIFSARTPHDLPVAVVDADNSALSREISRLLDASASIRVAFRPSSEAEAHDLMLRGEIYAAVVLPRELFKRLQRGDPAAIQVFLNQQLMTAAGKIAVDVQTVVGTLSARQSLIRQVQSGVGVVSIQPLRAELHPLFNPGLDFAPFLALLLITATLHVFVFISTAQFLGTELLEQSVPQWTALSGSWLAAVLKKTLPYTAWWLLFGGLLLFGSYRWLGMGLPEHFALMLAGLLLLVVVYQGLALLLVMTTANYRVAVSIASLIASPAVAFSGITFPLEALPLGPRIWAEVLPLTHFLHLQVEQAVGSIPAAASAPRLLTLAAMALAFWAIGLWRARLVLRTPSYWGRE